ncbi:hypothetical protein MHZ95_10685 [Sporosarcina sp. ACRSM]|uniref:hypothetical protein n=1 Tax=Sporosarcina sp. ACRSM TaxID=2918216 RepID=UPI001EF4102A|nr:hypothetical protein [Sporosarcina sp. ACRSM]MCG7335744.1 hypothetical protein [Sporosarcina sp. ACRSM]
MKGKWKGFVLLTAVSLLAAGCSTQGNAQTQETVIVNEDVQLESSLADSTLEVSRLKDIEIGQTIENRGLYKGSHNEEWFLGDQLYYNKKDGLYSLDIVTKKEKKLAEQEVISVSNNGNWALTQQEEKVHILNLQSGDMQWLEKASQWDVRFVSDDVAYYHSTTYQLNLFDVETQEEAVWDLSDFEGFTLSFIKKEMGNMYIAAHSEKNGYGVYQLKDQGQIAAVANFGGDDTQFNDFNLLQDGSLLFNGTYDGKTGIYYWDKKTKAVQQLVSGGKDSEGIWVPFYNLSPDESKIMFDMPVQIEGDFKTNVYMAEIADGQLTNSVRIMENTDDLYAVISLSGHWSEDSKTAYITTSKDDHEHVGDIAVFQLKE